MTTTRNIAHNTAYQLAGKILSTFLGVLALGMMTRYLGTEKFGWYVTTISFLQFVGILIDFGLIPVTAQMMSEPKYDKTKLFQNLLGFRFVTAIIFLGIAPFIALFFPYPPEVKIAIALSTISFLAVAMNQIFIGFYQTKMKMHIQAIGENIGRLVMVMGLWLLFHQQASFLPIMCVVILNSVAYTIFMWCMATKYDKPKLAFDWQIWKKIIIKMWPIAISIICNVVYLKGDTLLLSIFRSQTEVGLYGAAYRVIDILSQMAMMIMGIMLPLLAYHWSRNLKKEFKKYYQQSFDIIMLLALPMTLGIIMTAPQIMEIVGGKEFISSGRPLQILAVAVLGVYLGAIFGHTAVSINRQKQTIWIYLSSALFTLIGYLIFIPKFGMYGAAWLAVFSELYVSLMLFLTVRYYTQEKLALKTFSKIIFSTLIMTVVLFFTKNYHLFIQIVFAVLIYTTMILLTKAISRETIKEIISLKKHV